jgi:hypothetical protein
MRSLIAALVMIASGLPALGGDSDECRCRGSDGQIFHEGDLACIKTAKGPKLARCEMALNNTTWTVVRDDCPTALGFSPVRLATIVVPDAAEWSGRPGQDHARFALRRLPPRVDFLPWQRGSY